MAMLRKNAEDGQYGALLSSGAWGFLSQGRAGRENAGSLKTVPEGDITAPPPRGEFSTSDEAPPTDHSVLRPFRAGAQRRTKPLDAEERDATEDLFRRVGYHDLRAYTQLVDGGLSQGFVLVRHHTLVGTVQKVFRVGAAQPKSAVALAMAVAQLNRLACIVDQEGLALDCGEQSI